MAYGGADREVKRRRVIEQTKPRDERSILLAETGVVVDVEQQSRKQLSPYFDISQSDDGFR